MKVNESVFVVGPRMLLEPYERRHVPTYHKWMEDEEIREATASERLTLEEEYENQVSWRESSDKLTFIICDTLARWWNAPKDNIPEGEEGKDDCSTAQIGDEQMGDVNMFLSPWIADDEEEAKRAGRRYCVAEVDIMIADPKRRKRGFGRQTMTLFLLYVRRHLDAILNEYKGSSKEEVVLKEVFAKIRENNAASIGLFKSLGFVQRGEANYFGEVELVLEGFGQEDFDITARCSMPREVVSYYKEVVSDVRFTSTTTVTTWEEEENIKR
ncbi:acetyltransferase domain-containing protein [Annulohypoxylon stygium]|nr:acetyltransferase domain-containing protein [Annulohypoxylon stygium]